MFGATVNGQSESIVVPYASAAMPARQFNYGSKPRVCVRRPPLRPRSGLHFDARLEKFKLASDAIAGD